MFHPWPLRGRLRLGDEINPGRGELPYAGSLHRERHSCWAGQRGPRGGRAVAEVAARIPGDRCGRGVSHPLIRSAQSNDRGPSGGGLAGLIATSRQAITSGSGTRALAPQSVSVAIYSLTRIFVYDDI